MQMFSRTGDSSSIVVIASLPRAISAEITEITWANIETAKCDDDSLAPHLLACSPLSRARMRPVSLYIIIIIIMLFTRIKHAREFVVSRDCWTSCLHIHMCEYYYRLIT